LIADDRNHGDLAVRRHALLFVGFIEKGVHALTDALGDARRLPQPDRRSDNQDIGVENALPQLRPLITSPLVRLYAGEDVEVDNPDNVALAPEGRKRLRHLLKKSISRRLFRAAPFFKRAVQRNKFQIFRHRRAQRGLTIPPTSSSLNGG